MRIIGYMPESGERTLAAHGETAIARDRSEYNRVPVYASAPTDEAERADDGKAGT